MSEQKQREAEIVTPSATCVVSPNRKRRRLFAATALTLIGIGGAELWWWADENRPGLTANDQPIVEINWQDLVPEGYSPPTNPLDSMTSEPMDKLFDGSNESNRELAEIEEILSFAPVVPGLDGKRVKLAGYVVPLEFDGQTKLDEFLVVPYYGACIHTPPPPANQVVHARAEKSVTVEDPYLPVWAVGTLQTQTTVSNLAEAGYKLQVEKVLPYEE